MRLCCLGGGEDYLIQFHFRSDTLQELAQVVRVAPVLGLRATIGSSNEPRAIPFAFWIDLCQEGMQRRDCLSPL